MKNNNILIIFLAFLCVIFLCISVYFIKFYLETSKYGYGGRYNMQYYGEQYIIFDTHTGMVTYNIFCKQWEKSYGDKYQCHNLISQKVEEK